MKSVTGTSADSANILDIFGKVKSQGGFGRRDGPFIAEGANGVGGGKAFININYSMANHSISFISAASGRTIIHELLHVAANSALTYSHFHMASAAYAATGKKGMHQLLMAPKRLSNEILVTLTTNCSTLAM